MSDLKPCPFCGCALVGVLLTPYIGDCDGWGYVAECGRCWSKTAYYNSKDEAAEAWNRRAERTCEFISSKGVDRPPVCSACGYELDVYDCEWYEGGTFGYAGNYCPVCGAKVVK